jgi:hypothetical protein
VKFRGAGITPREKTIKVDGQLWLTPACNQTFLFAGVAVHNWIDQAGGEMATPQKT